MTKSEYRKYIQSEAWQQRRRRYLSTWAWCERCWIPRWLAGIAYDQDLHVHHRSYANLGAEKDDDLEALCRRCHEIETFGRSDLREIARRTCACCNSGHFDPYSDFCHTCGEDGSCCAEYIQAIMDRQFGDGPHGEDPNYKFWTWFIGYCLWHKGIDAVKEAISYFKKDCGEE